jgi:hypothetical protein
MFRKSKCDTYEEYIEEWKDKFLKWFNEEEWYFNHYIKDYLNKKYKDYLKTSGVYDIRIRKAKHIYIYLYITNHTILPLLDMEVDLLRELKQKCEIILIHKKL